MRRFNTYMRAERLAFIGACWVLASPLFVNAQVKVDDAPKSPSSQPAVVLYVGQSEVIKAPWPIRRTNITDPKIAQAEPLTAEQVLVQGKALGTTDLLLWSAQEEVLRMRIDVVMDLRRLTDQLNKLFPGADLELVQNQNILIINGSLRHAEDSVALHQFFDAMKESLKDSKFGYVDTTKVSGVQQVNLLVRVAEASRSALRSLGINVFNEHAGANSFFGASTVGPSTGGNINNIFMTPTGGAQVGNNQAPVPYVFNNNPIVSPFVTTTLGFPRADLLFLLQALAENQYLRVLAEPNLVAQSGEEANFLAGGEFPIPIVQGSTTGGGTSITVEYKEFGVRLKFRPVVLGDGSIRLYVAPEVSDISDIGAVEIQGFRIPALTTRRASTTLELHSGQTFSIAGLMNKTTKAQVSRVPGAGDLPVVGALFRSVRYQEGETELVILVTASLVEPMSTCSVPPLPGDTHRRPNDWEVYLGGMIEGSSPPPLSETESDWLKKMGFGDLRGPGAWATYGEDVQESRATLRPAMTDPGNNLVKRSPEDAP